MVPHRRPRTHSRENPVPKHRIRRRTHGKCDAVTFEIFDLPNHVRASFTSTLISRSRTPEFVTPGTEYFDHPLREKEELHWPPRLTAVQALEMARGRGFRGSLSLVLFFVAEYETGHLPIYGFCPAGEDRSTAIWLSAVSGRTLPEPPM